MSRYAFWSKDEIKKAKKLYIRGDSVEQIAALLGRSVPAIENRLKRDGIKRAIGNVGERKDSKEAVLGFMKGKTNVSLLSLCRGVKYSLQEIEEAIENLRMDGYEIKITDRGDVEKLVVPPRGRETHIHRIHKGGWVRFGLVSDTHLSNREHRIDVLNTAYDHYKAERIKKVYHCGNMIDGYAPGINAFELVPESGPGIERQIRHAAALYPKTRIETHFITGQCHEGWYGKGTGLNVGQHMEDRFRALGRKDLKYAGHMEADIELRPENLPEKKRGPILRLMHPSGGTSYAISYRVQKYTESLQEGEKPQLTAIGHYHKHGYFMWRGVHCLMAGCAEDQTIFMRGKNIGAHVGYWIVDVFVNPDGVMQRVRPEFVPFFDRGFYKKWEYF